MKKFSSTKNIVSLFLAAVIFVLSLNFTAIDASAASKKVDIDEYAEYLSSRASMYENNIDVTDFMRKYGWSSEDLKNYSCHALLIRPEMFYVDTTIRTMYTSDGSYFVQFTYLYKGEKRRKMEEEMKNAAKKAVSGITNKMTDVEKALIVHDYIIMNCKYDQSHKRYNAYDCLVTGSAVCQGYALAYKYVMENYCGIKCSAVISVSQNHVWNYVRINGKWYHVDVTADDPCYSYYSGESYDGYAEVSHKNLLVSDTRCKNTNGLHRNWEVIGGYPEANDKTYDDFFWTNSCSQVIYNGGLYYFANEDINSPFFKKGKNKKNEINVELCSYSFKTGKTKKLATFTSIWFASRSSASGSIFEYGTACYKRSFSKIAMLNGKIYLNTANNVFSYDIASKKTKKVYTLKKGNNQIFAMKAVGDKKIRLCYKYDITYEDNYLNLNISA